MTRQPPPPPNPSPAARGRDGARRLLPGRLALVCFLAGIAMAGALSVRPGAQPPAARGGERGEGAGRGPAREQRPPRGDGGGEAAPFDPALQEEIIAELRELGWPSGEARAEYPWLDKPDAEVSAAKLAGFLLGLRDRYEELNARREEIREKAMGMGERVQDARERGGVLRERGLIRDLARERADLHREAEKARREERRLLTDGLVVRLHADRIESIFAAAKADDSLSARQLGDIEDALAVLDSVRTSREVARALRFLYENPGAQPADLPAGPGMPNPPGFEGAGQPGAGPLGRPGRPDGGRGEGDGGRADGWPGPLPRTDGRAPGSARAGEAAGGGRGGAAMAPALERMAAMEEELRALRGEVSSLREEIRLLRELLTERMARGPIGARGGGDGRPPQGKPGGPEGPGGGRPPTSPPPPGGSGGSGGR